MIIKFLSFCLTVLAISSAEAKSVVPGFQERFEITQNSDGETVINDRKLLENVTMLNFVNYLKEIFKSEDYLSNLESTAGQCVGEEYDKKNDALYKVVKKTVEAMSKFKFDLIINSEGFAKFLAKFEDELNAFISKESVRAVANLDNSKYFYEHNTQGAIVDKLKDFIKDAISIPGGVKLALFFGESYQKYILQKRAYDQNILLTYLLTYTPEELGLSSAQADQAISSIFESQIRAKNFFSAKKESKKAQSDWDGYGKEKVTELREVVQKSWKKNKDMFDSEIRRIDPAFSIAQFKGSPIYISLSRKTSRFSSKASLTFDEACPNFVYLTRYGYSLARIGMDVLGVPFSGTIDKLLIEQYQNQIPLEGLLYGTLEIENSNLTTSIKRQTMNPFIK